MARPAACSFAVPAQHERDRSLVSTRDPRRRPIIATVGQRIEKEGDNEKRCTHERTHARTHTQGERGREPPPSTPPSYTRPCRVRHASSRCSWSEAVAARTDARCDAMRNGMRRDEARTDLPSENDHPSVGAVASDRRGILLSRESRARCKLRFSAVRLGRRIARGMMAATVVEAGEGEGERRRSRTHMSVVCNRRARDVLSYHRRRDPREDEHRSGRAIIAKRRRERDLLATSCRRGSLLMLGCCSASCDRRRRPVVGERRSISRCAWKPLGCHRPTDSRVYGYMHGLTRSDKFRVGRGTHSRVL